MSAVRRSTRLSSISKLSTPTRRSDIWQLRQKDTPIYADDASDDEDQQQKRHTISKTKTKHMINNENIDAINMMKINNNNKKINNCDVPKTPSKNKIKIKPMPASKKRERLLKISPTIITIDSDDNGDEDNDDDEDYNIYNVSPPKQARKSDKEALPKHLISPTRLLDRLSLDERPKTPTTIEKPTAVEEVTPKRNKYQNARRVLNSAETQNLPGREEQLIELRKFFTEHLDAKRSGSLYVSGQPGTGKTACLSLLLRSAEYNKRLQRVYINCTSIASVGGVYKKICNELNLKPIGRTERDYLAAVQEHIRTAKRMILIVLDEIDQLCNTKQSVLYTIFEWPAMPKAMLLLVGIANSLDLTDRALMRLNARCELKPQLLHFPPYTKQQIVDIFKSRLEEAGVLDVFPPVSLQLLAAKVSAISGDVRRALDIGRRVVEIAEQQKQAGQKEINLNDLNKIVDSNKNTEEEPIKPVQITQVAAVLNKVYGASQSLEDDIEGSFPLQQKIMICTLMLMLRNERNKDINLGRLHEVYRRVCNKRNINVLDQAEFNGVVDLVETRGILRLIRKKEPRQSKIQLQWDEEEVNDALKDKQLISSILDDRACLNK